MKSYTLLTLSIILEVFATAMLKQANGFEFIVPLTISVIGYIASFYFLGLTLKHISLSIAYAIWAGAGTVLTTVISMIFWGEPLSLLKAFSIALIIGGIVVLNFSEEPALKKEAL